MTNAEIVDLLQKEVPGTTRKCAQVYVANHVRRYQWRDRPLAGDKRPGPVRPSADPGTSGGDGAA